MHSLRSHRLAPSVILALAFLPSCNRKENSAPPQPETPAVATASSSQPSIVVLQMEKEDALQLAGLFKRSATDAAELRNRFCNPDVVGKVSAAQVAELFSKTADSISNDKQIRADQLAALLQTRVDLEKAAVEAYGSIETRRINPLSQDSKRAVESVNSAVADRLRQAEAAREQIGKNVGLPKGTKLDAKQLPDVPDPFLKQRGLINGLKAGLEILKELAEGHGDPEIGQRGKASALFKSGTLIVNAFEQHQPVAREQLRGFITVIQETCPIYLQKMADRIAVLRKRALAEPKERQKELLQFLDEQQQQKSNDSNMIQGIMQLLNDSLKEDPQR